MLNQNIFLDKSYENFICDILLSRSTSRHAALEGDEAVNWHKPKANIIFEVPPPFFEAYEINEIKFEDFIEQRMTPFPDYNFEDGGIECCFFSPLKIFVASVAPFAFQK